LQTVANKVKKLFSFKLLPLKQQIRNNNFGVLTISANEQKRKKLKRSLLSWRRMSDKVSIRRRGRNNGKQSIV
jgi:hypothetical protein